MKILKLGNNKVYTSTKQNSIILIQSYHISSGLVKMIFKIDIFAVN